MWMYQCEICGASLDAGEKCDCQENEAQQKAPDSKKDKHIITRKGNSMEIKIYTPEGENFVKAIEWNHEEIKAEISEKVAFYNNLVYTDDQIKEAKADRADLNKFKTALEDKRKEIKSQCLAPYEKFEKQMKEIVSILDEPIKAIDTQVKAYEEEQKQKKEEAIREYFNTKEFNGFTYEQIAEPKWLNATTSMKSIQEAIDEKAANIEADMQILSDLPEYAFEALEVYKRSMDVRAALAESKRLTELAKAKAEYEAQKAQEATHAAQEPIEEEPVMAIEIKEVQDDFIPDFDSIPNNRSWVATKIYATPDDLAALREFLNSRSIPFEFL